MNHCRSILTAAGCWVLLALAAVVARADEPIVFSKPKDALTEKANAFMEQQPHKLSGNYNASKSVFDGKPQADFDILPGYKKPRPFSPAELKAMEKNLDQQRNWALQTPEEIFRLPTAEKIFGIPDPDQNLSATDRYLKRQDLRRNASATNAFARAGTLNGQDEGAFQNWRGEQKKNSTDGFSDLNERNRTDRFGNRIANGISLEEATRRKDSPWSSSFDVPDAAPKPDKAALAAMERFRALMEPPQLEKTLAPAPGLATPPMPAAMPVTPGFQSPGAGFQKRENYNPGGSSFKPVSDSASRPTGVMPLPTVTGTRPAQWSQPKAKPLVEPPPWVVEANNQNTYATPKPGVFSQRKF